VGTYSITAVYGGDGNFDDSTPRAIIQVIKKINTSLTRCIGRPIKVVVVPRE
jgi:hypothetical protein